MMASKTFIVPNISCGHCTHTVEMEVGDLEGVTRVKAEQESKQVTVEWQEPATWEKIEAVLQEINYPPEQLLQIN
jgi:copper chaperone CopZ